MKYRKLPVVIDAIRYDGLNKEIVEEFVGDFLDSEINDCAYIATGKVPPIRKLIIQTLEGKMFVSPGDYVIKGVNGEFYPCKPDIFEKTYEPASDIEAPDVHAEIGNIPCPWGAEDLGHADICVDLADGSSYSEDKFF